MLNDNIFNGNRTRGNAITQLALVPFIPTFYILMDRSEAV